MPIFNKVSGTRVSVVSDLHVNSTIGLCPPTVQLDDGGTYFASKPQRVLWEAWLDYCEKTHSTKQPVYVIINGDMMEADCGKSFQYIARNPSTIHKMVIACLEPLLNKAKKVFFVRGTEYHVGKSGGAEELVAKDFDNTVYYDKEKDIASWWLLRAKIDGVQFDAAHHVSMGNMPWTQRLAATKLVPQVMFEYANWGEKAPNIVLRSHMHRFSDSGMNFPNTRAFVTPCWCMKSAFTHRIGKGDDMPEIGGLIINCDKGKADVALEKYIPYREEIRNE